MTVTAEVNAKVTATAILPVQARVAVVRPANDATASAALATTTETANPRHDPPGSRPHVEAGRRAATIVAANETVTAEAPARTATVVAVVAIGTATAGGSDETVAAIAAVNAVAAVVASAVVTGVASAAG